MIKEVSHLPDVPELHFCYLIKVNNEQEIEDVFGRTGKAGNSRFCVVKPHITLRGKKNFNDFLHESIGKNILMDCSGEYGDNYTLYDLEYLLKAGKDLIDFYEKIKQELE